MDRCAPFLSEGHLVRAGQEGDPLYPYPSPDEAPSGRVTSVFRGEGGDEGAVRFEIRMEDGSRATFDNRSVQPSRIWEIHPSFLESFRGVVSSREKEEEEKRTSPNEREGREKGDDAEFRSTILTRLEEMHNGLEAERGQRLQFERTMADTIRHISSDLINVYRGEKIQFSGTYADRYDQASVSIVGKEQEAHEEEKEQAHREGAYDDEASDPFRGSSDDRHSKRSATTRLSRHAEGNGGEELTPLEYRQMEAH